MGSLWIAGAVVVIVVVGIVVGSRWLLSGDNDFRKLGWSEAFERLHARMSEAYPFTEWKDMDWNVLYAQTAPRIAEAESLGDREIYYLALREYIRAVPDGHVAIGGEDLGLRAEAIGGGYGLAIIGLDDGRVVAHILLDDSPAARAGMIWGAEILTWSGLQVDDAIAQTPTLWANPTWATLERRYLDQCRYLVRAPQGTSVVVTFLNPGETAPREATLVAEDDALEALTRTLPLEREALRALFTPPIRAEVLSSGYGYITISGFMPTLGGPRPAQIVDRAMADFVAQDVQGIIIDVRGNGGGLDALVPQIVGHFYDEPGFYEYVAAYDPETGQHDIDPEQTLTIEPRAPFFSGTVMVLVDSDTASTAEGIPLAIRRLPQGHVVGIHGTNGSFAVGRPGDDLYQLPEGIVVSFLSGRSLDADGEIQVDANADGIGGVVPDIRVPLTEETVHAIYVEGEDVVLKAAVATMNGLR